MLPRLRNDAQDAILQALAPVRPDTCIQRSLSKDGDILTAGDSRVNLREFDSVNLIAVGKAACPMARAAMEILGNSLNRYFVCTKRGHGSADATFDYLEASHPVPDDGSVLCAEKALELASSLTERDLLLVLISGGASALMCAPAIGITLEEKQAVTGMLLRCGANIHEINTVRKHLSRVKGGRLAQAAAKTTIFSLILSDVPGDNPESISSGPTVPDPGTFPEAVSVMRKYDILESVPKSVSTYLTANAESLDRETPKPGDAVFIGKTAKIIGSNSMAQEAAVSHLEESGYHVHRKLDLVTGEARKMAGDLIREARATRLQFDSSRPFAMVCGGETTVTICGDGTGGRNQEMALAAAIELDEARDICFISFGTDGNDGPTDAAGAIADPTTIPRACESGMDAGDYLANNDSSQLVINIRFCLDHKLIKRA